MRCLPDFPKTIPQDIPIYGTEEYELMNPIHNVHLHTWYISDLYIHAKCLMCVIFKKYMQYDLFKKYLYHEAMKCTTYPLKASHFCWHLHLSTFPHGSSRNSPLVLKPPWSLHTKKKGSFEKKTETGLSSLMMLQKVRIITVSRVSVVFFVDTIFSDFLAVGGWGFWSVKR